jgi:ribosomal protein S18 acetylase RimI-like enzyme
MADDLDAYDLVKELFTEDYWDEVQTFDCGSKSYEVEVSDWLKRPFGEDGALTAIRNSERPARVWLYRLAGGTLVGFGAIAESKWRWKGKKDPSVPVTVIIWLAVAKQFQGLPKGPGKRRYSIQIVDDLIDEALALAHTHPVVGLCVHPENERAIKLYKQYGFTENLEPFTDKLTGITYLKMAMILSDDVLIQILDAAKKKK